MFKSLKLSFQLPAAECNPFWFRGENKLSAGPSELPRSFPVAGRLNSAWYPTWLIGDRYIHTKWNNPLPWNILIDLIHCWWECKLFQHLKSNLESPIKMTFPFIMTNFKPVSHRENSIIQVMYPSLGFSNYQLRAHLPSTVLLPTFPLTRLFWSKPQTLYTFISK